MPDSNPTSLLSAATRSSVLLATALALAPLLLQLPMTLAIGFAATALLVAGASWRKPLPLPLRILLVLGMLATIYWQMGARPGRDTGCALLAAMLAIKSSELRNLRDARSLIGFALFAPFAAFLLDQGPLTLTLALAAVVVALLCLRRLADVEGHAPVVPLSSQLRSVGHLALVALPLALVAFWLFPRLASPLWGIPERAVGRPGLSDSMSPGKWLDLMSDDSPALRVQFQGPTPPAEQRYWRGPVLSNFDGQTWRRAESPPGRPLPAIESSAARWSYQIEYEPTDRRQLVALDLPLAAPEGTFLNGDYSLFSARPLTNLTRWQLRSAPPRQFQAELSPWLRQQHLHLPETYNPRSLALARQWRAQAGSDDRAIVGRALEWIRRDFAYTLDTPLPGRHSVDEFLFDQQAGFCEHFSAAFVVLMRGAGIPARVVTGYTGGVRNSFGDYWVVRKMDAHAWAEVWLPESGWTRVDPTAAVAPERIYDTLEDRLGNTGAGLDLALRWQQAGELGDWLRRGWNDFVLSFDANRQQHLLRPLGIEQLQPSHLLMLFSLFAAAVLGWMAWLLARGEREPDPLLRAWHQLETRYTRRGHPRDPHEPVLQWAQRTAPSCGGDALLALSQRFSDARYAGACSDTVPLVRDLRGHRPKPGALP